MSKSKLVRNRVVLNQSSLALLNELNIQAAKVDCAVVIGVLPNGTLMFGGETTEPTAFYMLLSEDLFKNPEKDLEATHIGFTREEVLEKLLGLAEQKVK
jgi:hypothetical protein